MMVQEVCFPSGLKMLVIPIFLPIIPFIVVQFVPSQVEETVMMESSGLQSPFATDLFL
jgi:hypothetical protein